MQLSDLPALSIANIEVTAHCVIIRGRFNHMQDVIVGGCFLYLGPTEYYWCESLSLSSESLEAAFSTNEHFKCPNDLVGKVAYWVSNYWNPCNVTYIIDPAHPWKRVIFHATEALETKYEDGSRILRTVAKNNEGIRVYPVGIGAPNSSGNQSSVFADAWDHEHCEICNKHIDPGDAGYLDEDEHWLCQACYTQYAITHDLSFLVK